MLDINLIREKPEIVAKTCKVRGYDINIGELTRADEEWRGLKQELDKLRHKRNTISQEINQAKKKNDIKKVSELIKQAKEIPEEIKLIEEKIKGLRETINTLMHNIPNIPDKSVPIGNESKNKTIKKMGRLPKFSFKIKPHWQLGQELDILDLEQSAKLAGSGFYVLKGKGAQLQRALVNFMIDFHVKDNFTEINPPQLANSKTLFGTGNLPKFEDQIYKTTQDELYLIPTAEVPLTNLHANEDLEQEQLPKKYVSFTQCYRTEAGKHGTETRGIFRLHQFEKVEMVYICKPENSYKYLEEMRQKAEKILQLLKLPYVTKILATQDMGFAAAKTYDIEVYSPYQKKYLEVSSCSNCTDFQARRMNTKYKTSKGNEFVHTLNGSGLALPRLFIALLENYQQSDSSIKIPQCLHKYTGFKKIEAKKAKTKEQEKAKTEKQKIKKPKKKVKKR